MLHFSRLKVILARLAVVMSVIVAPSNVSAAGPLAMQPDWMSRSRMTVGVNQQSGSRVVLGLDQNDVIKERLQATRDEIGTRLRGARIGYKGLAGSGRTVQVRITDPAQVDAAKEAVKELTDPVTDINSPIREMTFDETEAGLLKFTVTDAGIKELTSTALAQSIEVIKTRLNELGIAEPVVVQQGDNRILVQASGVRDTQRLKDILGQTAKLTFQLVDQSMAVQDALNDRPPVGSSILYAQGAPPVPYLVENRVIVSNKNLLDANATYNSQNDEPVVLFRLDSKGTARFGMATSQNVGRVFAVVLDDRVISAPMIREPILSGYGQISGSFTAQNAKDIALLLRAGPLPVKLTIVEEDTIGAGVGQN